MNLTIEDGEFVALLGPSGCGKSTSLFMLAGIYLPSGGELLFDGHVVNEVEARDRNIGIVFQSYALYPHMTVRDNILFPLRFKRTPREEALARVKAAADLVHVGELLDRRPSELSGGQQQRVALARALVKEPQLLLLDEPLSNLDATLRLTMRTEIKSLQEKLGVTTILVTHDQIEATTMADRIICMRAGRIEQVGTPDDLYLRPKSLFIASFIGSPSVNLIRGEARTAPCERGPSSFPFQGPPGGVTIGLRPEHLRFAEAGLRGRIAQTEPMGREILYVVETDVGHVRVLEHGSSRGACGGRGGEDRLLGGRLAGVRRGNRKPDGRRAGASAGVMDRPAPPSRCHPGHGARSRSTGRMGRSGSNGTSSGRAAPKRRSSGPTSPSAGVSARASKSTFSPRPTTASSWPTTRPSAPRRPAAAAWRACRSRPWPASFTAIAMALPIPMRRSCRSPSLVAPLRRLRRAPEANLQLDLKVPEGRALPDAAVGDAAAAVCGLEHAIVIGSHYLEEARRARRRHARRAPRLRSDARGVSRPGSRARSGAPLPPHGAAAARASPSPICNSTSWSRLRRRASRSSPACSTLASRPTPGPSIPARADRRHSAHARGSEGAPDHDGCADRDRPPHRRTLTSPDFSPEVGASGL